MTGVLLSLIPLFTWGAGDYIASKYSKGTNSLSVSMFFGLVGFSFSMLFLSFYPKPTLYFDSLLFAFAASVFINIGFLSMLKGFASGPIGIVAPIANAYAVITAAISVVIFKKPLLASELVAIMIVIAGISLISYIKPKKKVAYNFRTTIMWSIIALFSFGIGFVFFDKASTQEWYKNMVIFQAVNIITIFSIWFIFQKKNKLRDISSLSNKKLMYIGGAAGAGGMIAINAALKYVDNIAIPAAVAAAAPMVTAILAYIFDKEHLTIVQRAAAVMIVVGIVILSVV